MDFKELLAQIDSLGKGQQPLSEQERKLGLANLAKEHGYAGAFDPIAQGFVDIFGNYIDISGITTKQVRTGSIAQSLSESFGYKPAAPVVKESTGNTDHLTEMTYLFWEGGHDPLELKLYYNNTGLLQEYSWNDLRNDVSDTGAGVAAGMTFGYADNIKAGIMSMYKGTRYADELKTELQKTDAIKKRSPMLYMAGNVIGAAAVTAPLGFWGGAAALGAQYASDKFIRDPHNSKTLADREAELAKEKENKKPDEKEKSGTGNKPANSSLPTSGAGMVGAPDPQVKILQQRLVAAGFSVGIHKDDGRFGPDTIGALQAYTKKFGGTDAGNIKKLLNTTMSVEPSKQPTMAESISEAERMARLRDRLAQLDEENLATAIGDTLLSKLVMKYGLTAAARGAKSILKIFGPEAEKGITVAGEKWTPQLGQEGKIWTNGSGKTVDVESLATFAEKEAAEAKRLGQSYPPKAGAQPAAQPTVQPTAGAKPTAQTAGPTEYVERTISGTHDYRKINGEWYEMIPNKAPRKLKGTHADQVEKAALKQAEEKAAVNGAKNTASKAAEEEAAATKVLDAEEQAALKTNPGKASLIKRIGNSRIGKFLKNNKLLTFAVGLAAFHYMFNDDGNIVAGDPTDDKEGTGDKPSDEAGDRAGAGEENQESNPAAAPAGQVRRQNDATKLVQGVKNGDIDTNVGDVKGLATYNRPAGK